MSAVAVRVEGVSKRFQRGERHDSLRDLIPALVRPRRSANGNGDRLADGNFWAVRDVDFRVEFGSALGIIGPNGAGKSTLLKLLTGILRPNRGEIGIRGRCASLIEVSAGFHPDLTGRENVFLQGAVMGMSRHETLRRMEDIIDFAGIEEFIDTPVKRYSSGMNARLGFAIAVHLDPDVLLIDEVLSVGDMAFQTKCIERMKAFKRDGVAIVFVSHNMQAIGELCDKVLVLKSTPRFVGEVGEGVSAYLRLAGRHGEVRGTEITAERFELRSAVGGRASVVAPHTRLVLDVYLRFTTDFADLTFGLVVYRASDGLYLYGGCFASKSILKGTISSGTFIRLRFDFAAHLVRGQYAVEFNVYDNREQRHVLVAMPAAGFRVDEYATYDGIANLEVDATAVVAKSADSDSVDAY